MSVWRRDGVVLSRREEIARAAELCGAHPMRVAFVMREILDSARALDMAGAYAVDWEEMGAVLKLDLVKFFPILNALAEVGWLKPKGVEGRPSSRGYDGFVAEFERFSVDCRIETGRAA